MSPTDSGPEYYQFEEVNNAVILLFRETRREQTRGSVLDLGCGRARLGFEIERLRYTVTGIDNSPVPFATARTRISGVIEDVLLESGRTPRSAQGRQLE